VDVAVVGVGAAGLATAIFLARSCPGAQIHAFDGAAKIGAKILVSGGGRCNVSNARVTPADYYGGNRNVLRRVLAAFTAEQTREFFREIGVPLHEEEHGKLFPDSNKARTVVNALLGEADRCGVCVHAAHRVTSIARDVAAGLRPGRGLAPTTPCFTLTLHNSAHAGDLRRVCTTRFVVLATGGRSLPKTGSDGFGYELARRLGHRLIDTTPALDPLVLSGGFHRALSGVSHEVELTIHVEGEKPVRTAGALLWTHFGVSGPAALNASRFWNRARLEGGSARITANLLPGRDFASAERELLGFADRQPRAHVATALHRWLPARVAEAVLAETDVPAGQVIGQLARERRRELLHALLAWPLQVERTRGYNYAEVTAGGVPLDEIDPSTMESRRCPGLFLVGEMLDVDGRIGGFNFQWAWSSAAVAAADLVRRFTS